MARTFLKPKPQLGGDTWLANSVTRDSDDDRKAHSFLRSQPTTFENESQVEDGRQHGSFLKGRRISIRKEPLPPTSSEIAPDSTVPRTIATETLLSDEYPLCDTSNLTASLYQPVEVSYTNQAKSGITNDQDMAAVTKTKCVPPHLRNKKEKGLATLAAQSVAVPAMRVTRSTAPKVDSAQSHVNGDQLNAPKLTGADIRDKLEHDHGVKVGQPKPAKEALVNYPSSNDDNKTLTTGVAKLNQPRSSTSDSRRGKPPSTRGRGGGRGGRRSGAAPRASKWPTAAEQRADPKRWEIDWEEDDKGSCASVDSACANGGFGDSKNTKRPVKDGIDPDTGFQLTDWSGNWAPAPVDWDARPAFRDGQSAQKIERWMDFIEERMGSTVWAIPMEDVVDRGTTYSFMLEKESSKTFQGDLAPRYWISDYSEDQAPRKYWADFIKSEKPKPIDEDDLVDAKPWWELYQLQGGYFIQPYQHLEIKGIDPREETEDERLARENDYGSNQHTENRKRKERAKKDAQRERRRKAQEKFQKLSGVNGSQAPPQTDRFKPKIKLHIRSAKPDDIPRICEIYNYYVDFTVCTPETKRRTVAEMKQWLNNINRSMLPFLVAYEPGEKMKKKGQREAFTLPDKLVGFAFADDFHDKQSMYRFTAEMQVFVDKEYYMKDVAKCLCDKLMGLLDPHYIEKGGYEVVGQGLDGIGGSRIIANIVVDVPYEKDQPARLEWIGKWLESWLGFEKAGELFGIGLKNDKIINLAMFQRKTGEDISPTVPKGMAIWQK